METKYELTHSELIAVFEKWATEARSNPEQFRDFYKLEIEDYGKSAAKEFVRQLDEIRKTIQS